MPTGYPRKVKDYAKELFLEIDEDADRLYSYRDIARMVNDKYYDGKKQANQTTVLRWIKANGWEALLQDVKNAFVKNVTDKEQKREEEAKEQRRNILGEAEKTFEASRDKTLRAHRKLYLILMNRAKYTEMLIGARPKPKKVTWEEVRERALTPQQESVWMKLLDEAKQKQENLLLEGSIDRSIKLIIEVIDNNGSNTETTNTDK